MKKIKNILSAIIFVLCFVAITPGYAGNGNGNNGNGNGNGGSNNGNGATLPINNGLVFLLAAGIVIGSTVIYKINKKGVSKSNNA